MAGNKSPSHEENLDPTDWESMRALGHRMVDDVVEYLKTIRDRPAWRHAPSSIREHFSGSAPLDPQSPEDVYQEFYDYILPWPTGNIHPRFWGWVFGTGTILGAFAEMLSATMNTGAACGLSYNSANYVEVQVLDWLKDIIGFPASASGVLTTGCSEANLIGLAVARNTKAGYDLRREGIRTASRKMVLYASEEIHSSVQKAIEILGLGSKALHTIPVDENFRIDLQALTESITRDRKDGLYPLCVVGAAGTTNTGAVDDLEALADICQKENLWFHVDGAFGAWAAIAPGVRAQVKGMERADSLAFDLHKWMYMPYEIGCVLVQHEDDHRKTFCLTADYLAHGEGQRGMSGQDIPYLEDYGIQLSRGFRALKAWISFKEHGVAKYGRMIQQNIDQTNYLVGLINSTLELELMAPANLNVVCFRYVNPELDDDTLDKLNKQIVIELQEEGKAIPSTTKIRGRDVIHIANTNHRTRRKDFDILVREVIRLGRTLSQSLSRH
jgi:glutamate/tyrosine decarboxylase-like PLP-dependent enzyme